MDADMDIWSRWDRLFEFGHLPDFLQEASAPFRPIAKKMIAEARAGRADPQEIAAGLYGNC